jgi:cysteine desulfurase family protein (TIGR01976 family)
MLDLSPLRAHFPSLQLEVGGRPAVFLDNPAGTQVPQQVIDAITGYLLHANANTGGAFLTSQRTDEMIAAARQAMADMLGCDPDEVVFGPNMTTLAFALSRAIGRTLSAGDEIVVTTLDHDANVAPWVALEEHGAVIRRADIHVPDCTLDTPGLLDLIGERTRVVAVGYASNAVGTINDLKPIIARAHEVGAVVFVDAVQYAPHGPIDVRDLGCDFLACSSYKFFGPHLGILYGRRELLESLPAYKVRPAKDKAPDRWETGTKNHECMAALPAIADYLAMIGRDYGGNFGDRLAGYEGRRRELLAGMEALRAYEAALCQRLLAGLGQIKGLQVWGIADPQRAHQRVPTVSMTWDRATPDLTARYLGEQGIFVWSGNYYAISLMERLGLEGQGGAVRIGLAHYNTAAEVDRLVETLEELPHA